MANEHPVPNRVKETFRNYHDRAKESVADQLTAYDLIQGIYDKHCEKIKRPQDSAIAKSIFSAVRSNLASVMADFQKLREEMDNDAITSPALAERLGKLQKQFHKILDAYDGPLVGLSRHAVAILSDVTPEEAKDCGFQYKSFGPGQNVLA